MLRLAGRPVWREAHIRFTSTAGGEDVLPAFPTDLDKRSAAAGEGWSGGAVEQLNNRTIEQSFRTFHCVAIDLLPFSLCSPSPAPLIYSKTRTWTYSGHPLWACPRRSFARRAVCPKTPVIASVSASARAKATRLDGGLSAARIPRTACRSVMQVVGAEQRLMAVTENSFVGVVCGIKYRLWPV
jgi:hypothetical protein